MKRKALLIAAPAALGVLPALMGWNAGAVSKWETLSAPARLVGKGLRNLSLSGWAGNLVAWAVVLLVCALPLLLLVWDRRRGTGKNWEDWLVVLMIPQVFALLYDLVNPTLLGEPAATVFPLAALGTVLSTAVAWLALKVLRGMDEAPTQRLAAVFHLLLTGCAVLLAFGSVWGRLAELTEQCAAVIEGNSPMTSSARFTILVLFVLALLELAPDLLAAVTLLWGADLTRALGEVVFSRQTVALCARTAGLCRGVAQITVLLAVGTNLLQLCLLGELNSVNFSVVLPLFPLALSAALFLLCRCLQRGKELQDDSDSII